MNDVILQCADIVPLSVFLWKLPELIGAFAGPFIFCCIVYFVYHFFLAMEAKEGE